MSPSHAGLRGDEPISSRAEDVLNRSHFAGLIAREVVDSPKKGRVCHLGHGDWGTGKTSVLKMVEETIGEDAVTVWFNAWLFSSGAELVSRFFAEVAAQLNGHQDQELRGIAERAASYGKALAPLLQLVLPGAGSLVSAAADAVGGTVGTERPSTREQYLALAEELRQLNGRLVVFIDDIDRLRVDEINEVMRLVKLVGDLPNVVYVLAFARERVERALGDKSDDGGEYLEKIVQVPHTLPAVRPTTLQHLALNELQTILGERALPFFDERAWAELVRQGIAPMITTLRDARRYANVASLGVDLAGDEIAGHDLLALEALRVFEPALHAALPRLRSILTGQGSQIGDREKIDEEHREAARAALATARHPDAAGALLRLLFPAAGHLFGGSRVEGSQREWRLNRRVASPDALDVYLYASFGDEAITTAGVVDVIDALADEKRLRKLLSEVDDHRLNDLLDRVQDFREQFGPKDAAVAAGSFLDLFPRLRIGPGFALFPPEWALAGVLRDLLRAAAPEDRVAMVEKLFENAPSLTARWYVIAWFGVAEKPEDQDETRVLSPEATDAMSERLRQQVIAADPAALKSEPQLLTLLGTLVRDDDDQAGREIAARKLDDDDLFVALLVNSMRYADWWKWLTRLTREDVFVQRLTAVSERVDNKDSLPGGATDAIARATRRAAGERGDDLGW